MSGPGWEVLPGDPLSRVVLHVPHGATAVPDDVRPQLLLSDDALRAELAAMTDSGTRELAAAVAGRTGRRPWRFVNRLSRLVVDPERLPDDREEMRAVGMGAVYTRTSDQRVLRDDDPARDAALLADRFVPYADALADLVDDRRRERGSVVLVDVHSFPPQSLPYELHPADRRPQVCLGTDPAHTPAWLLDAAREAFGAFDVALDEPFRGTYVPLRHLGVDRQVASLMVEVRRDVPPDGDAVVGALVALLEAVETRAEGGPVVTSGGAVAPVGAVPPVGRRRRRAVGPPGARPAVDEPLAPVPEREPVPGEDDHLLADRPPHHDRGV